MRVTAERTANWLIILTALCALPLLGLRLYEAVKSPANAGPERYAAGESFSQEVPIDLKGTKAAVVIFVSSGCQYCTKSMDFYRRVSDSRSGASQPFKLIVVGLESVESLRTYTQAHNLGVDQLLQVRPGVLKLTSTPSLLLVAGDRKIKDVWYGQLPPEKEQEVLGRVKTAL